MIPFNLNATHLHIIAAFPVTHSGQQAFPGVVSVRGAVVRHRALPRRRLAPVRRERHVEIWRELEHYDATIGWHAGRVAA